MPRDSSLRSGRESEELTLSLPVLGLSPDFIALSGFGGTQVSINP